MATLTKSFGIKAESMGEDGGTVTGYASTFSRERDSYGDVVAKGAFLDTLAAWKEKNAQGRYIPLLWGHDTDNPSSNIGRVISAEEDDYGLLITAELDSENEKAQYVRRLLKQGRVYQFSFAYAVLDQETVELEDGTKANELRKLDLFEVSIVPLPANRHAEVTDVKSGEIEANPDTSVVEVKSSEISADFIKAGRRNSAKDADDLNRIKELCGSIESIVNGLLADTREPDEQEPEPEEDGAKANAEEPEGANAEEPAAKSAEVPESLQQRIKTITEGGF